MTALSLFRYTRRPSFLSISLASPIWCARDFSRYDVDEFKTLILHDNLKIVGQPECGRVSNPEKGPHLDRRCGSSIVCRSFCVFSATFSPLYARLCKDA